MPREDEHEAKAERNEKLAGSLDIGNPTAEEWAIISAFYAALHYVQAYFVMAGAGDCDDHKKRFAEIARDPISRHILPEYKHLYKLGHLSRYKCSGLPPNPYRDAKARLDKIKWQVRYAMTQ